MILVGHRWSAAFTHTVPRNPNVAKSSGDTPEASIALNRMCKVMLELLEVSTMI